MDLAVQGAIWLGAGVTLVMLLSRRRSRRALVGRCAIRKCGDVPGTLFAAELPKQRISPRRNGWRKTRFAGLSPATDQLCRLRLFSAGRTAMAAGPTCAADSWTEPTVYAVLALAASGETAAAGRGRRGFSPRSVRTAAGLRAPGRRRAPGSPRWWRSSARVGRQGARTPAASRGCSGAPARNPPSSIACASGCSETPARPSWNSPDGPGSRTRPPG